jgi:hypothetical protein
MINRDISKVNLDVARRARRDSSLMKSLAILGMVFLPASLVTVRAAHLSSLSMINPTVGDILDGPLRLDKGQPGSVTA